MQVVSGLKLKSAQNHLYSIAITLAAFAIAIAVLLAISLAILSVRVAIACASHQLCNICMCRVRKANLREAAHRSFVV